MTAEPLEIHVIADSTGESAARIARAAMAQFHSREFSIVRHRKMNKTSTLLRALEEVRAAMPRAAVVFTLVNEELAELVTNFCRDLGIPFADLMSEVEK